MKVTIKYKDNSIIENEIFEIQEISNLMILGKYINIFQIGSTTARELKDIKSIEIEDLERE